MARQRQTTLSNVPPGAHRRDGLIERWQFWAPLAVVLFLVAWRALDHAWGAVPGPAWHTPGSLAAVHAAWEGDCAACHTPFTPLSAASWVGRGAGAGHAADAHCRRCHAGADHHRAENADERAGCTACHREHRGREASLLRVPDAQCTRCHANLQAHLAEDARTAFRDVRRFDRDRHPEFRAVREGKPTPARLKFNHRLHLTEGMTRAEGGAPFTLGRIDAGFQARYRPGEGAGAETPVRLDCSHCHQLDDDPSVPFGAPLTGVPLNAVRPARARGAALLPTVYEKHCQGCHPLTVERNDPDDPASGAFAVPHRLQPAAVRPVLQGRYAALALEGRLPVFEPPVPLPGKAPGPKQREALGAINDRVYRAEQELYVGKKTCGECHFLEPGAHTLPAGRLAELRVRPTELKAVGFEHAAFDHAAHRLLRCEECHPNARTAEETKEGGAKVLLPGVATCLACHAPRAGAARHDCVECHRYHDGDHPLSGRGAAARAGGNAGTRTVPQFLGGR